MSQRLCHTITRWIIYRNQDKDILKRASPSLYGTIVFLNIKEILSSLTIDSIILKNHKCSLRNQMSTQFGRSLSRIRAKAKNRSTSSPIMDSKSHRVKISWWDHFRPLALKAHRYNAAVIIKILPRYYVLISSFMKTLSELTITKKCWKLIKTQARRSKNKFKKRRMWQKRKRTNVSTQIGHFTQREDVITVTGSL